MQTNPRKSDLLKPRKNSVTSGVEKKPVRSHHIRRIPYKVGYSWNKGGRLKELRIRHLARKFLKIWMNNTFGRVLPHEAMSHHNNVVLRRAFIGWRDEWWTSRREWSLILRAECHHRYYLYNWTLQRWKSFVSMQRKKKTKLQKAQRFADQRRLRLVWDSWEVFTEMRRMKNRMLQSALEQNRFQTMSSAWNLWRTRLQQHRELQALEDQTLKRRALTLQSQVWTQWKDMYKAACRQKEKESKAALYFILRRKRKALHQWVKYVTCRQSKRKRRAVARCANCLRLVRNCWSKWSDALDRKQMEENRLQAASFLAKQSVQRRAMVRWKAYVTLCRRKVERNHIAVQHFHHHLLRAGLQGFSLHVTMNKSQRLNRNMAVQHWQQTMTQRYWKIWQERLEEAEDQSFESQSKMALMNYRILVLRSCFQHWREKLAEQRHIQDLERQADTWFVQRVLPRCFRSWVEFTLQKRKHEHRRLKAEVFNRERQYSWVFYTWLERAEKHKEETLSERMAILHEERGRMQRSWTRWRQRTQQRVDERQKQDASRSVYLHRLLHKAMVQWKDNTTEIRDRRNREQQACRVGDLRRMRSAVEKWKKFVQSQRQKRCRLKEVQHYHEAKLLKHYFVAWKKHHLQMSEIYDRAEELHRQQTKHFLGNVLTVWRENAVLLTEIHMAEQRAQHHFEHFLQLKVFTAWREATTLAVSKRHQQEEALSRILVSMNQVRLLQTFRKWREQTRDARRERVYMERARRHHNSKLLSKTLKAWKDVHHQRQKNKVMKRQGNLLLRLKIYHTYYELWKVKLQHRRREVKQTERALWHWSLTLQAKVLSEWRLCVTEQRRQREEAARAAQVYRDQLLREGVTRILTYAAHMNDLTTSLTQYSQEQRSQRLQRVVKRCAMKWKQRALSKPQRDQEARAQPPKKSVTFSLPPPRSVSSSVSSEQGTQLLRTLLLTQRPRRQPHRCEELLQLDFPSEERLQQCDITTTEPHMSALNFPQEAQNQDVLLPPSAFMTTGTKKTLGELSVAGAVDAPLMPSDQFDSSSEHCSSTHLDGATDSASALTRELLGIQLDMKKYQQSRKQLRAWRKLKEVLQNWLLTSGKDEQMEKNAVCNELKELEERIHRLSAELDGQKPTMLLYAERVQHLQSVFHTSGGFSHGGAAAAAAGETETSDFACLT